VLDADEFGQERGDEQDHHHEEELVVALLVERPEEPPADPRHDDPDADEEQRQATAEFDPERRVEDPLVCRDDHRQDEQRERIGQDRAADSRGDRLVFTIPSRFTTGYASSVCEAKMAAYSDAAGSERSSSQTPTAVPAACGIRKVNSPKTALWSLDATN